MSSNLSMHFSGQATLVSADSPATLEKTGCVCHTGSNGCCGTHNSEMKGGSVTKKGGPDLSITGSLSRKQVTEMRRKTVTRLGTHLFKWQVMEGVKYHQQTCC